MTFQVLVTGGYDSSIRHIDERLVFFLMIAVGVSIVSILIGLISDTVGSYMENLSSGSSKVVEDGHTLILGWNQATTRVVCQIAFLRRVFLMQNETWERKILWWRRAVPSSPVACSPVVIMNQTMDKTDMEQIIGAAFAERSINPKRTKIGRDVVFRKGNPCSNHDLVRVGAHKATSVLVMMTEVDAAEQEEEGALPNSATVRTVLALRNIIYSNGGPEQAIMTFKEGLRVVVQLSETCPFIQGASFLAPLGHECLYAQDITKYINSMLFSCATKPSLSRVIMSLVDFQGASIRTRPPSQLRGGKRNEVGWFIGRTMREAQLHNRWGNGIVIGVDDAVMNVPHDGASGALGIMGDPDRIIQEDDSVVFISPTSTPSVANCSNNFGNEAKKYMHNATRNAFTTDPDKLIPTNILICGWREVWLEYPSRFRDRVAEMVKGLVVRKGSTVTVINPMPKADMAKLLEDEEAGFRPSNGGWTLDDLVTVYHFEGDATKMEDMEDLMISGDRVYSTAIVLGTTVNEGLLSAECSDSRVLGQLLILRVLCEQLGINMVSFEGAACF